MKIIKPVVYIEKVDPVYQMKKIEYFGRLCYKSEGSITETSYDQFIRNLIKRTHTSVLEHGSASVLVICDRGVTHEIVRHRIGSYSQESTRYCNYTSDKFDKNITFIEPYFYMDQPEKMKKWEEGRILDESEYFDCIENKDSPQLARACLPNSLKTEIGITYNLREWRHFFGLRCAPSAHPQMRQISIPLLLAFKIKFPAVFADVEWDTNFPEKYYASISELEI